jgi:hypothetical protein
VALLVPAKLATSGYAEPLRRRLARGTRLERVAPIDDRSAAFGAAVYPMAVVAARAEAQPDGATLVTLDASAIAPSVPQRSLQADGPWVLLPDAGVVARRLRARFPALRERWTPQLGVKTGADALFVVAAPEPGTRPAVRGRDVRPFDASPSRWLFWTHDETGRPLRRLTPALAARFEPHLARLRGRADYRDGVPWQVFRVALAVAPWRVCWPDLARRLAVAVPPPGAVPLNTVYGVVARDGPDSHGLAAWLNGRWLTALARLDADPARGGFRRFNARVVGTLPVPADGAPVWATLAALGGEGRSDDELIAATLELDARDRRALEPLAPHPR